MLTLYRGRIRVWNNRERKTSVKKKKRRKKEKENIAWKKTPDAHVQNNE